MGIVLQGFKFGIVLAFLVGPVFFALLQTSVERGFRTGLIMALGISLSDAIYVVVCYFGLAQFINDPSFHTQMAYIGGSILILFGLYNLLIKAWRNESNRVNAGDYTKNSFRYFFKGFVINGFSPTVPLFWIGTISLATIDLGYTNGNDISIFFGALLLTVLITDITKAYLAGKLRNIITTRVLRITNIVLGLALLGFGIKLIFAA